MLPGHFKAYLTALEPLLVRLSTSVHIQSLSWILSGSLEACLTALQAGTSPTVFSTLCGPVRVLSGHFMACVTALKPLLMRLSTQPV